MLRNLQSFSNCIVILSSFAGVCREYVASVCVRFVLWNSMDIRDTRFRGINFSRDWTHGSINRKYVCQIASMQQ